MERVDASVRDKCRPGGAEECSHVYESPPRVKAHADLFSRCEASACISSAQTTTVLPASLCPLSPAIPCPVGALSSHPPILCVPPFFFPFLSSRRSLDQLSWKPRCLRRLATLTNAGVVRRRRQWGVGRHWPPDPSAFPPAGSRAEPPPSRERANRANMLAERDPIRLSEHLRQCQSE
jgi:hypothetical protein